MDELLIVVPLSERELEVLGHIGAGLSNKAIAELLFVETVTVRSHTSNIYTKLNVANRTEATLVAQAMGLLEKAGELTMAAKVVAFVLTSHPEVLDELMAVGMVRFTDGADIAHHVPRIHLAANSRVWICQRFDEEDTWQGALLVAAASASEAETLFLRAEGEPPGRVRRMVDVWATGEARLLYDDESR